MIIAIMGEVDGLAFIKALDRTGNLNGDTLLLTLTTNQYNKTTNTRNTDGFMDYDVKSHSRNTTGRSRLGKKMTINCDKKQEVVLTDKFGPAMQHVR